MKACGYTYEIALNNWRARASNAKVLDLPPLQVSLLGSASLDYVCESGSDRMVLAALTNDPKAVSSRVAPGSWTLYDEALMKGWENVARYIREQAPELLMPQHRLAEVAIDAVKPHDTCDVEIRFSHSSYVTIWAHFSILSVRCPLLAEELEKIYLAEKGADQAPLYSVVDADTVVQQVAAGESPNLHKREKMTVLVSERFSVMKAVIQFIYYGMSLNPT